MERGHSIAVGRVHVCALLELAAHRVSIPALGRICDQVGTWPHDKIKDAAKELYRFASDYPGIRHGGTPANARRDLDMRDMVAISVLLVGFAPYLTDRLDPASIYRGGAK